MKNYPGVELLLFVALLAGCTSNEQTRKEADSQTLPVVTLTTQPATLHREYVGNLEAVQNVEIRARVAGFLDKIYVDEGRPVRRGQPLFQINGAEYQSELTKAKANLKSAVAEARTAELELNRVRLLVEKKIISSSELEVGKAKLEAAKAAIEEAQSVQANAALRLSHALIRAPFDGVINRIPFKLGSLIEEGALLTSVSDIRQVYAYFNVSEKEYLEYVRKRRNGSKAHGQEVELLLADDSPYTHKGTIETMESVFEGNSGTIAFRARFPNPDKLLKHGATGKIRLANEVNSAVLVPQKAVFEIQDKNYVFVVDRANKVKMKSFVPQGRLEHFYLVKSGLQAGDRVVYEGIQNIREGMEIVPKSMSTDSLLTLHTARRPGPGEDAL